MLCIALPGRPGGRAYLRWGEGSNIVHTNIVRQNRAGGYPQSGVIGRWQVRISGTMAVGTEGMSVG